MKKTIALLLCLSLCLCVLAGCGKSGIVSYTEDEVSAQEEAVQAAVEAAAAAEDPANAYSADTVVATINGRDICWGEYYYWLNNYYQALVYSYGDITDWDALNSYYTSSTNAEVVRILAQDAILYYNVIMSAAEESGVASTIEEAEEEIAVEADSYIGDGDGVLTEEERASFEEYLAESGVSYDTQILIAQQRMSEQSLYTIFSSSVTDEDVSAWLAESGYMSAKHILLLSVDTSTREALSDEEIAAAKTKADELYTLLAKSYAEDTSEDKAEFRAYFDELMNQYSEDTGLASYPDGYVFTEGQMVDSFEETVKSLDENYGLSGVVESEYGYHIILRQPLTTDVSLGTDSYGYDVTAASAYIGTQFNDACTEWTEAAEVVWQGDFETIDLAALFPVSEAAEEEVVETEAEPAAVEDVVLDEPVAAE